MLASCLLPLLIACSQKHEKPHFPTDTNSFSIALFKRTQNNSNQVLAPYGVYSVFALAYPAADGATKKQIGDFFHYPKNLNTLAIRNQSLQSDVKGNILTLSNSLWLQDDISIKPAYKKTVQHILKADISHVNFQRPSHAAITINTWVSKKTDGLIQHFLDPNAVSNATSVLINTIYFNCLWDKPFDKTATTKQSFYTKPDESKLVPMMNQQSHFAYLVTKQAQIINLPYQHHRYSMLVILPKKTSTLTDIKSSLSSQKFNALLNQSKSTLVNLYLPKFDIKSKFQLQHSLAKMGLTLPFSAQANFSNFTDTPAKLHIDALLQSTHIIVSEKGTKAAAATAAVMLGAVAPEYAEKPILMNVNHPFIFVLYDNASKTILFIGNINKPN